MRLWFGVAAGIVLFAGISLIALWLPGYSQVQQTVSELGEIGSPGRVLFAVLLCLVAACLLLFASGVANVHRSERVSVMTAWLIAAMAVSAAGVGLFAYPDPLHNLFGLSELVGYQAPLAAAIAFARKPERKRIGVFSLAMYVVVLLALAANLTTLHREGSIWLHIRPYYGLVQRSLFAAWFSWCAVYAVLLMGLSRRS
jgi:hypothetical membrane protein